MPAVLDFAVIGGGASGMAAAIAAAQSGDHVLLLEKSPALGRKIAASGNGRCNLMNSGEPVYYGDSDFAAEVFRRIRKEDLIRFWNEAGLFLAEEDQGRMYPMTFQSATVLDALKTLLNMYHTEIKLQTNVLGVRREEEIFAIDSSAGSFRTRRVLVAAGGAAYPRLGGTEDGYRIMESLGHTIIPPFPALCPLCTDRISISGLSGIRVRCGISLLGKDRKLLYRTNGEVLFTDYGISGICAMQCARFVNGQECSLHIDLTGDLFTDREKMIDTLRKRRKRFERFSPEHILNGILVPKLSFAVLKQAGITLRGRTAGSLTDEEISRTAETLRDYSLRITETRGFTEAQVSAGGVDCAAFDPSTMESSIVPGLHAAGEVLNVDGDCGGFNLMFATATGLLAGKNGRN